VSRVTSSRYCASIPPLLSATRSDVIGTSTSVSSRVAAAPTASTVVRPSNPASAAKRLRCFRWRCASS
jgi:hypothetical protein